MSALALDRPNQESLFGAAAPEAPPPPAPTPVAPPRAPLAGPLDGPTLDDVISHAWEALSAQVAAACPVCGGEVEPHAHAPGGRCAACASALE